MTRSQWAVSGVLAAFLLVEAAAKGSASVPIGRLSSDDDGGARPRSQYRSGTSGGVGGGASSNASHLARPPGPRLMRSEDLGPPALQDVGLHQGSTDVDVRPEGGEGLGELQTGAPESPQQERQDGERSAPAQRDLRPSDHAAASAGQHRAGDATGAGAPDGVPLPAAEGGVAEGPAALLQVASGTGASAAAGTEAGAAFLGGLTSGVALGAAQDLAMKGFDLAFGTSGITADVMDYPFACICNERGQCKDDFGGRTCLARAGTFSFATRSATPLWAAAAAASAVAAVAAALGTDGLLWR